MKRGVGAYPPPMSDAQAGAWATIIMFGSAAVVVVGAWNLAKCATWGIERLLGR